MFSTDSSNHGTPFQNGSSGNHLHHSDSKPATDGLTEEGPDNV